MANARERVGGSGSLTQFNEMGTGKPQNLMGLNRRRGYRQQSPSIWQTDTGQGPAQGCMNFMAERQQKFGGGATSNANEKTTLPLASAKPDPQDEPGRDDPTLRPVGSPSRRAPWTLGLNLPTCGPLPVSALTCKQSEVGKQPTAGQARFKYTYSVGSAIYCQQPNSIGNALSPGVGFGG